MATDKLRHFYRLIGKEVVPCRDLDEWTEKMVDVDPIVARTEVGPFLISTIFLGCDQSAFPGSGPPILFETMILGDFKDWYQKRYCTWNEAKAGHNFAVAIAKEWYAYEQT